MTRARPPLLPTPQNHQAGMCYIWDLGFENWESRIANLLQVDTSA